MRFANLGMCSSSKGIWMSSALAQLGFAERRGDARHGLARRCTSRSSFARRIPWCSAFDGDSAGRRAARRALEAALPHAADNRTVRFLFLPTEHDPDSYVREFGADGFGEQVDRAMPLSQFLLNEVLNDKDLDQPEGRAKALFDAKPLLQALPAKRAAGRRSCTCWRIGSTRRSRRSPRCATSIRARRRSTEARCRRAERRRVTGQEQRALRNLVMYPGIAEALDHESEQTLVTDDGARRVIQRGRSAHARELGESAEFQYAVGPVEKRCKCTHVRGYLSRKFSPMMKMCGICVLRGPCRRKARQSA